jgi:hypothetical protein
MHKIEAFFWSVENTLTEEPNLVKLRIDNDEPKAT